MEDEIDWNNLLDFTEVLDPSWSSSSVEDFSNPSPETWSSMSSWVAEIETMLMKDDNINEGFDPNQQSLDDFFSDVLVDSPASASASASVPDKDSNAASDDAGVTVSPEEEKSLDEPQINNNINNNNININDDDDDDADADDPISKKRRRQLRNRDAAVRSRERKKTYVKDLEMKSRYLEGECRKLGRLLQCVVAENQALRLSLQKGTSAFGASSAKQESAVLLLESLLLGSLLWFLGIMCLFTLPTIIQSDLELVPLENVEEKAPGNVAQRGARSRFLIFGEVKPRRCKASRTKMKMRYDVIRVLA